MNWGSDVDNKRLMISYAFNMCDGIISCSCSNQMQLIMNLSSKDVEYMAMMQVYKINFNSFVLA